MSWLSPRLSLSLSGSLKIGHRVTTCIGCSQQFCNAAHLKDKKDSFVIFFFFFWTVFCSTFSPLVAFPRINILEFSHLIHLFSSSFSFAPIFSTNLYIHVLPFNASPFECFLLSFLFQWDCHQLLFSFHSWGYSKSTSYPLVSTSWWRIWDLSTKQIRNWGPYTGLTNLKIKITYAGPGTHVLATLQTQ